MAKRKNLIHFKITDDVSHRIKALGLTMRDPRVTAIIQQGAELVAEAVRQRAPLGATGNLRAGVYTASSVKDNFRQLTRRGGKKVNENLRFPPRRGQVLIASSTFYALWVEKGRTPRVADPERSKAHERRAVGRQGTRKRGRPFFRPAVRAASPAAMEKIHRELDKFLWSSWVQGRVQR